MRKLVGVTENYWATLNEDYRFYWRNFCRIVTILSSYFVVTKTEFALLNLAIGTFATLLTVGIIEPQRTYSKFSPRLRKTITRAVIVLISWSIALVGIAIFAGVGVGAFAQVGKTEVDPILFSTAPEAFKILTFGIFIVSGFIAIPRSIRALKYEEMIFEAPKRGLKQLLVNRGFKVDIWPDFLVFEGAVLFVSLAYCSVVASIVNSFVAVFRLL